MEIIMEKNISKLALKVKDTSVLIKLMLSYLILIIILASTIGFTSYYLSSRNYNNEVFKLNKQLLEQYSTTIEKSIINTANETRKKMILDINLSTDIDILFQSSITLGKIPTMNSELNAIVNSSNDLYQGIHIYSKDNNLVLSSVLGLKYLDSVNPNTWENLIWVTKIPNMKATEIWLPTHEVSYSSVDKTNVFSYITTYPANQTFENAKGYIRFDINENYLMKLLKNIDINGKGELLLIDNRGNIVAHSNNITIPSTIYDIGYPSLDFYKDDTSNDSTPIIIKGEENILSYVSIGRYWKLIRSVPVKDFYSVTKKIAIFTAGITILAVICAIIIARIFASNIYSPLKLITSKLRDLLSLSNTIKNPNEYEIINKALINYDNQILNLNKKWDDNIINLKQNLLRSIIRNTIQSEDDFNKRMKLIGKKTIEGNYNIIIINLVDLDSIDIITKDKDIAINNLLLFIENLSDSDTLFIASQITSDSIGALANSNIHDLTDNLKSIIAFASNSLNMDVDISMGAWRDTPLEIHDAFKEATSAYRYRFFIPLQNIFDFGKLKFEDNNSDDSKLKKIYSQYSHSLISDDDTLAQLQISNLIDYITECDYPLEYRYDYLENMTQVLANYFEEYYIGESNIDLNIYNIQEQFSDIYDYGKWLTQATCHMLELKKNQIDRKVDDIIYNIKRYINENLAKDLSLTRLSEYTTLSNSYLSHIFKESTGTNVVDYITEQRMIRAKSLLETTVLNIEVVASSCGYGTPHYFSKKFKQYFGLTPRSYRIAYGENNNKNS